jgi:dipeptidyl aminopeptidase/acylaminoacyl peptidase
VKAPREVTLRVLVAALVCVSAAGAADPGAADPGAADHGAPSPAVERLLTASPPPRPILHAGSGRVALCFQEAVVDLERLARPVLGLAGYRFDPVGGTSNVAPLVQRVEVVDLNAPAASAPVHWRPPGGALLDHVRFSPDGRHLSALVVTAGPARLALFDVATGQERVLATPVNAAWGDPCTWATADTLVCRLVPADLGAVPAARVVPTVIDHLGGPAPTRTYANLLESANEDALFEHYFAVEVAQVGLDGRARRVPGTRGLLAQVQPSPDGDFAVVTRIQRPFSRLVPARLFPTSIEVWDLARGERRYASPPVGYGVATEDGGRDEPRHFAWRSGAPTTLGWIERATAADGTSSDRWYALEAPFRARPREIARSERSIRTFGWTTAGTPYFSSPTAGGAGVAIHVVSDGDVREVWQGRTAEGYDDPGRAVRVHGATGPVLEVNGRIFLAGDGLGPGGAQPFLDVFDLGTGTTERIFTADAGVFEVVLGVLDPNQPRLLTSRETETEPPNLYVLAGGTRTAVRPLATPYPDLEGVERRVITYRRGDGVALSGTLYLPAGRRVGAPLPTLLWIYPYEFSDRDQAEQLDVRGFQFHKVKGPSPLALLLEGYAVLLNPTVPIVHDRSGLGDDYLGQLVASAEAAVDHLIALGVAEPGRIAVAGRSYGAFSSANLLIHSRRFATAIAMSGAYNRTLTPFGFQHERRSFWDATDLYTSISPFFHANRITVPVLLVHGGTDENPGTPPLQARRFFHALVGEGVRSRYVELPFEGHHYWARENVLHAAAEMIDWLGRTIGERAGQPATGPAASR